MWLAAAVEGGWTSLEELRQLPFTVVTDARGINLLEHAKVAAEGAEVLARIRMRSMAAFPSIDLDVLIAGALLHDVNKAAVFERDGNGAFRRKAGPYEVAPAVRLARDSGLPGKLVDLIAYESGMREDPPNVETILVHHADMPTFAAMDFLNRRQL